MSCKVNHDEQYLIVTGIKPDLCVKRQIHQCNMMTRSPRKNSHVFAKYQQGTFQISSISRPKQKLNQTVSMTTGDNINRSHVHRNSVISLHFVLHTNFENVTEIIDILVTFQTCKCLLFQTTELLILESIRNQTNRLFRMWLIMNDNEYKNLIAVCFQIL